MTPSLTPKGAVQKLPHGTENTDSGLAAPFINTGIAYQPSASAADHCDDECHYCHCPETD